MENADFKGEPVIGNMAYKKKLIEACSRFPNFSSIKARVYRSGHEYDRRLAFFK